MKLSLVKWLPNLVKSGVRAWEVSKAWNTKKKVAVLCVIPLALIVFALVVNFVGVENAAVAADLMIRMLEAVE